MADALEKTFGIEATLVPGSGGAFEVTVDGELIFSKLQSGRFPSSDEIEDRLKELRK